MVRYVSPTEFQRIMREQQRALEKYNRDVRAHNQEVERRRQAALRAIDDYNRKVDNHNREVIRSRQRAIDDFNRAVRAHNSQVRSYALQRQAALNRFKALVSSDAHHAYRTSTLTLNEAYERLENRIGEEASDANDEVMLAIPASENINGLEIASSVLGGTTPEILLEPHQTKIENELRLISVDLDKRWRGAKFALNADNPDAARHFCTSAREIFSGILDLKAPDTDVVSAMPTCQRTQDGKPTRRSKIEFILKRRGIQLDELRDFIEADVDNILQLFHVFNSATHGEAGRYEFPQLAAIRQRVEGGILFLSKWVLPTED